MDSIRHLSRKSCILVLLLAPLAHSQQPASLPEIHQLMREVREHQKTLDKVRENFTFTSTQVIQDLDGNGQVKKTETDAYEIFFVNGQQIGRLVKKNGQPLTDHELQKETERVTKEVEKAEKSTPEKPREGQELSLSKILECVEIRNPRRDSYRGRPTIIFDFKGRKDFKAHGIEEDAAKVMQGTIWVDEADLVVAHLDVSLDDNFHVAGGLFANIAKGSNFHFDQAPISDGLWLPSASEGFMQARILLVKGLRQHFTERDSDYKRFHVDAQQAKDAKVAIPK